MLSNPHLQNLLALIGIVYAYNIEGHNDPAWLCLALFLLFWGWWKDLKVIAAMIAVRETVSHLAEVYGSIETMVEKLKEKNKNK